MEKCLMEEGQDCSALYSCNGMFRADMRQGLDWTELLDMSSGSCSLSILQSLEASNTKIK